MLSLPLHIHMHDTHTAKCWKFLSVNFVIGKLRGVGRAENWVTQGRCVVAAEACLNVVWVVLNDC